jgi:hypothetical protein
VWGHLFTNASVHVQYEDIGSAKLKELRSHRGPWTTNQHMPTCDRQGPSIFHAEDLNEAGILICPVVI